MYGTKAQTVLLAFTVLLTGILVLSTGSVSAAAVGQSEEGYIVYVAPPLTIAAVNAYYKVTGSWPSSWQQVKDSRLYQTELRSNAGNIIDPDDQSLDFDGDVVYTPPTTESAAIVSWVLQAEGMPRHIESYKLETIPTYAEFFSSMKSLDEINSDEYWEQAALHSDLHVLFALASVAQEAVTLFRLIHGSVPDDWNELATSGIGPVDLASINPITGEPLDGVSGPYSIVYTRFTAAGMSFQVAGANGKVEWSTNY